MVNQSIIQNELINDGINTLSVASQTATDKVVQVLANQGFNVSTRWASLLVLAIGLGGFYLATKISQKVVKIILIILSVLLLFGLLVPW